jgi:rare lipoprotein A
MSHARIFFAALALAMAGGAHAQTAAASPAPAADVSEGKIAYYGQRFAGRKTANGERFNPQALTMAHKTLPMGTKVRVTNLATQKSVVLRVNDRGPSTADRVGDVSVAAARQLRMLRSGVTNAKLEVVGMAKPGKAKA